ncbi:MAG: family 43 glycosylhydrolase [Clostridiales bacterium]|nr:family 43 glycosylhydrolase [Clostridiales bacterium]
MLYTDSTRGSPCAKDPAVVRFNNKYYMYYSLPPYPSEKWHSKKPNGWNIGIAISNDLEKWEKVGEITPAMKYEMKGLCAPGAIVIDKKLHLFYQNYGNFPHDAICHAISKDGINFVRDASNPIFSPSGSWNNGRAIDADVAVKDDKLFLYTATRDPHGKIQKLCVASSSITSDFSKSTWKQECDDSILQPELPWEMDCIEAPAVCMHNKKLYMFYGGAYNCSPQQIGCAISKDGLHWKRISEKPFLSNGNPGDWNADESGHPYVFMDNDGHTCLFYQGSNDKGKTWYLSRVNIIWKDELPYISKI